MFFAFMFVFLKAVFIVARHTVYVNNTAVFNAYIYYNIAF